GAGISTLIAASILNTHRPEFGFIAFGIGGIVALVMQSTAWWRLEAPADGPFGQGRQPLRSSSLPPFAVPVAPASMEQRTPSGSFEAYAAVAPVASGAGGPGVRGRSVFARAFWGIVAFLLMGGVIVTLLVATMTSPDSYDKSVFRGAFDSGPRELVELAIPGLRLKAEKNSATVVDSEDDECYGVMGGNSRLFGIVMACIASGATLIFALTKITPSKRRGFWRETVRPFMMCLSLFGVGASIAFLTIRAETDEQVALSITGIVLCSLQFLFLLIFVRGKKAEVAAPPFFIQPPSGYPSGAGKPVEEKQAEVAI
ncbi:MAG: hypothetical protein AABZ47_13775, partial [Planctomycetota bacterium]